MFCFPVWSIKHIIASVIIIIIIIIISHRNEKEKNSDHNLSLYVQGIQSNKTN